jgi:predicted outer membrane protein/DMSO/TMAO reductase YedYZ heme-binding membrane subunit
MKRKEGVNQGWKVKSPRIRGIWLVGLAAVVFLPVVLFAFVGTRDQTSIVDRLLVITGIQASGLLAYTMVLATRFRSKISEFGVPLHRWVAFGTLFLVLGHILLALMADPANIRLLYFLDAPPRGAAASGAVICLLLSAGLGEFRRKLKLKANWWSFIHTLSSWLTGILAFAHILWVDKLVNHPMWLIVFVSLVFLSSCMWLTKAKGVGVATGGVPRFVRWVLVLGAILAVTASIVSWRAPQLLTIGYTENPLGPIGPADRDMLYKVKQAGLWEMPVGQEAASRATTTEFRDVGEKMAAEHHELDKKVTEAARQLGIQLPTEPSPDQQRWMREISAENGGDYDRTAVFLLRQAHGNVLPLLANVKAGTRNDVIRAFANEAMIYVNRHIDYLDSTGLVNYSQLPEPPPPSPYQQPAEASFFDSYDMRTIIIGALVVAVIAVLMTMLLFSLVKGDRERTQKRERAVPKHRRE